MCFDVHNQLPHPVAPLRLYKMDWMNYCTSEKSTRWQGQSSFRLMQLGDVQHTCSAVGCEIDSRAEGDSPTGCRHARRSRGCRLLWAVVAMRVAYHSTS